ncbi:AraC family transcriptional regulator [Dyadobacter frigoris]|uniref:Helix-turn-helix domain-containing protein n=1 Tax=Dyadobacter frigoris TaxID=2576211 RepID=A0A4U6CXL3_9BACT|nr:AraC family transcriptional regulator [Dyadobacter frigoris]TKT89432.1 helix-turn-helix domain-containing protein [Dyadobacter frigoris]
MQPKFHKILTPPSNSINVVNNKRHHFLNPFHYHPEMEISLVLKSSGFRFVGDSVESFESGDLIFVGSDIPHCWRNDQISITDPDHEAEILTVHFPKAFIGDAFYNLPECSAIDIFLKKSKQGIKVTGKTRDEVAEMLLSLNEQDGMSRIITLLSILDRLSKCREILPLASAGFVNRYSDVESDRINMVFLHVINNLSGKITLQEVAALTNLSETAFCRYFKSKTGKRFSGFLNEVRIGYACKILISSNRSITEIAYESGYNSLANFLIQFKSIMKITPRQYQLQYREI